MIRRVLTAGAALIATLPSLAAADEPNGCGAFKWPLESERAALARAAKPAIANGGALAYGVASTLKLARFAEAGLPHPPERAPKSAEAFAGHFTLAAPANPGVYKITLASDGWVDVLDNGGILHPSGFSGAVGCEGARKSVKFDLPARARSTSSSAGSRTPRSRSSSRRRNRAAAEATGARCDRIDPRLAAARFRFLLLSQDCTCSRG